MPTLLRIKKKDRSKYSFPFRSRRGKKRVRVFERIMATIGKGGAEKKEA